MSDKAPNSVSPFVGSDARRSESRRQRGSIILEAGLAAVLLMTFMAGIADAGYMLYTDVWVSTVARDATRYAMVRGSASGHAITAAQVSTYVSQHAASLNTAWLTTTTTWSPNNAPGSAVNVKVQYSFHSIVPFVPISTFTLQSTSQMIIQQ